MAEYRDSVGHDNIGYIFQDAITQCKRITLHAGP